MLRRRFLRATVVTLAAGVAGCGQDDSTRTHEVTPTATPTATPTSIPETDSPGDGSSAGTETPTSTKPSGMTPTDGRGAGATATATSTPTATATSTPATPTHTPVAAAQVVEVGPDGSFSFEPESFEVATGKTVLWVWGSSGHNVVVESAPDGSDWSGDSADLYGDGHTHTHTFATAGEYEYYCNPHRNLGMTGSFTVTE